MKWEVCWWDSRQGDRALEHLLAQGWEVDGVAAVPYPDSEAVHKIVLLKRKAKRR